MSLQLYCWIVGQCCDGQCIMVVADSVETARTITNPKDTVETTYSYNFCLNNICNDYGEHQGYTWKVIINYADPLVYDTIPEAIFSLQHRTG